MSFVEDMIAERDSMRKTLAMVADIAQSGGLTMTSPLDALTAIRSLTLDHWHPIGTEAEHRQRVIAAADEAKRRIRQRT